MFVFKWVDWLSLIDIHLVLMKSRKLQNLNATQEIIFKAV